MMTAKLLWRGIVNLMLNRASYFRSRAEKDQTANMKFRDLLTLKVIELYNSFKTTRLKCTN